MNERQNINAVRQKCQGFERWNAESKKNYILLLSIRMNELLCTYHMLKRCYYHLRGN